MAGTFELAHRRRGHEVTALCHHLEYPPAPPARDGGTEFDVHRLFQLLAQAIIYVVCQQKLRMR